MMLVGLITLMIAQKTLAGLSLAGQLGIFLAARQIQL